MRSRTFPVEEIRTVLPRKRYALRELAHQLHDLRYVIIVLAVARARRRVEQIIAASKQLKDLGGINAAW